MIKTIEEVILPLESIQLRLQKKTRIKTRSRTLKSHYANKYLKKSKNWQQSWQPLRLEQVSCIWYFINFNDQIKPLFDSINVISQAFVFLLGFKIGKTNIRSQKIDDIILKTYFSKNVKERFFKKSFLLAISSKIQFSEYFS